MHRLAEGRGLRAALGRDRAARSIPIQKAAPPDLVQLPWVSHMCGPRVRCHLPSGSDDLSRQSWGHSMSILSMIARNPPDFFKVGPQRPTAQDGFNRLTLSSHGSARRAVDRQFHGEVRRTLQIRSPLNCPAAPQRPDGIGLGLPPHLQPTRQSVFLRNPKCP